MNRSHVLLCAVCLADVARAQCADGSAPPCAAARRVPIPQYSVAVLSFQARSRDSADVFLAEGLADDIASRLGQLNRLTVRSREAVRRLRNADTMSVSHLGKVLNASYLLSGSVRPSGSRLHFVFELTRTQTGSVAWSAPFERSREELLHVQTQVAEAAARAMLGIVSQAERQLLGGAATQSDEAFAHIARGTAFYARRGRLLVPAMAEFNAAVAKDPQSATAWARLAQATSMCVWYGNSCPVRRDTLPPRARAAANRALALDSSLADSWLAEALVRYQIEADAPVAIAALRRAESLDHRNPEILHTLGGVLVFFGDIEAAIPYLRAALAIDPGRAVTYLVLARAAWGDGRHDEALALLDTTASLDPNSADVPVYRWGSILATGDTSRIRGAWSRVGTASSSDTVRQISRWTEEGLVALAGGDSQRASAVADSLVLFRSRAIWSAVLLMKLGRRSEAAALVRNYARPGISTWAHARSPAYALLGELPEFRAYMDEAKRRATTSPK